MEQLSGATELALSSVQKTQKCTLDVVQSIFICKRLRIRHSANVWIEFEEEGHHITVQGHLNLPVFMLLSVGRG